jgi:hypothetical protein
MFSSDGDTLPIDINLNGAGVSIGSGPQQALLSLSDTFGGSLSRGSLEGLITYTFTPAGPPAPEPSTWAMLLMGFAGLSYAAVVRRRALR